jgi:hypothetical protein
LIETTRAEAAIIDIVDYLILRAVMRYRTTPEDRSTPA